MSHKDPLISNGSVLRKKGRDRTVTPERRTLTSLFRGERGKKEKKGGGKKGRMHRPPLKLSYGKPLRNKRKAGLGGGNEVEAG